MSKSFIKEVIIHLCILKVITILFQIVLNSFGLDTPSDRYSLYYLSSKV